MYENDHVFKSRPGGILACAQFESGRSDPACVDQGPIVVELSVIMTCSTGHILR
jgi:hypothetical protein